MFKIFIGGRTMAELKENVRQCFEELEGKNHTVPQGESQSHIEPPWVDATPTAEPIVNPIYPEPLPPPPTFPNPFAPPPHVPAQVATPAAPQNMMEFGVDSKGLPWDERIHSVSQGTNKDGSWRYRRGVEDAQIEVVEQELLAKMKLSGVQPAEVLRPGPVPTPPPSPVAQVASPLPPIPPPAPVPAPFLQPPVVLQAVPQTPIQQPIAPPPAPAVAPTPQAPASIAPILSAHTVQTFKDNLVATLGRLVSEKKLTQEYVNQLKAYFGVEQIWQVNDAQAAEMFESFCLNGLLVKAE